MGVLTFADLLCVHVYLLGKKYLAFIRRHGIKVTFVVYVYDQHST